MTAPTDAAEVEVNSVKLTTAVTTVNTVAHAVGALTGLSDAAKKAAELLEGNDDGLRDTPEQIAAGFLRDCGRRGMDATLVLKNIIRLQRAYRLQIYVYKNFGAALFFDSQGDSSHGSPP